MSAKTRTTRETGPFSAASRSATDRYPDRHFPGVLRVQGLLDGLKGIEPTEAPELHAMATVTLTRPPAQMVDQQKTEDRACALHEAIVIGSVGVAIDEILQLCRKPADAGGAGSWQRRTLRVDKNPRGRHERAANVLQRIEPIPPHSLLVATLT